MFYQEKFVFKYLFFVLGNNFFAERPFFIWKILSMRKKINTPACRTLVKITIGNCSFYLL